VLSDLKCNSAALVSEHILRATELNYIVLLTLMCDIPVVRVTN